MLYKVVPAFKFVYEILKCDHSNESYWAVLSCGAFYYAVQGGSSFELVNEILKCDHSNESYWEELSYGAVYHAVQGGSNFWVSEWNPTVWPFKWKLSSMTFPVGRFVVLYRLYKAVVIFFVSEWNPTVWLFN